MELSEEDARKIADRLRISTELSTSTMVFLFDRINMLPEANPALTLTILADLIRINLDKMLGDDARTFLDQNPDASMDIQDSVDQAKEKLQELFDAFKKDGGITQREIQS